MGEKKNNLLDDIVEGTRRLLEDLERLVNPDKRNSEQEPVPVPIPVRPDRPQDRHQQNPYR